MTANNSKLVEGEVFDIVPNKEGNPYAYYIRKNNVTYFVHLGDIKENEDLLYAIRDGEVAGKREVKTLEKGDKVQFEPFGEDGTKHAIHVQKIK